MTWQWLLEANVLERLESAYRTHQFDELSAMDVTARSTAGLSTVDNGRLAVIKVEGILTKTPDMLVQLFYGANTAYDDIIAQIGAAEADPKVQGIRFEIDSPGGNVDGLFDALAAIEGSSKPKSVLARNALSAAYGIAAAAGNITASGPGAMFGSVGTAVSLLVNDDVVTLTSTNAPEKRPDPRTEEGRASIIRHLDAVDSLFVEAIAMGRGTNVDVVRQSYGRGASLLAAEAERRGMIDGIAGANLRVVKNGTQATAQGGSEAVMDLEQLKAEHLAVYRAAVEIGVQQERERVMAHIKLGRTGNLDAALSAIEDGSNVTQLTYATHMEAALNRRDVEARRDDDRTVEDALKGIKTKHEDNEDKLFGEVLTRLKALVGTGAYENG